MLRLRRSALRSFATAAAPRAGTVAAIGPATLLFDPKQSTPSALGFKPNVGMAMPDVYELRVPFTLAKQEEQAVASVSAFMREPLAGLEGALQEQFSAAAGSDGAGLRVVIERLGQPLTPAERSHHEMVLGAMFGEQWEVQLHQAAGASALRAPINGGGKLGSTGTAIRSAVRRNFAYLGAGISFVAFALLGLQEAASLVLSSFSSKDEDGEE